ncbi:MAG: 4-alpha-glucanotransferase [Nostoc sp.]|uniref:4-alpha-glucanotransferase n=1 Tax=Nostoc sp. TaxID=1180 RepID=UPI002FF5B5D3
MGYRFLRLRGFPDFQPGDFPRGLGGVAGVPLGPTGDSNSPYASYSAIAGNPLLISPQLLYNRGLIAEDFTNLPKFSTERVDFSQVIQTKIPMLQKACKNFKTSAT